MSSDMIDVELRAPGAYGLARRAVEQMEADAVWPTPLNFELWLNYVSDPQGPLALDIRRLLDEGLAITEAVSHELAAQFLPRHKLPDQLEAAGEQLTRQLEEVGVALDAAHSSSQAYSRTLSRAASELEASPALAEVANHLALATRRVERENADLQTRLARSTHEVRRLREHLERVRREAMTDPLTKLPNRKAFDEALEQACAQDGGSTRFTLALVDVDHFKRFNDTWGHQTGDQVLRYVASMMARLGAPPRLAARYGGEEFAVLFPSETADQAIAALNRVRRDIVSRVLKRRSTDEDLGTVSISGGVVERRPGDSALTLMEKADAALYASKNAGRNRITKAATDGEVAA